MCCVAPLRFSFSVSPTCRCFVRALFRAPFCLFRESLTSLCVHCPSQEFGGLRQLPLPETSRRLTRLFHTWFGYWPNPTCRPVGKMYTSRVLVLLYYTHPLYTPTYSCYSPATMAAEKRCSKTRKIHFDNRGTLSPAFDKWVPLREDPTYHVGGSTKKKTTLLC